MVRRTSNTVGTQYRTWFHGFMVSLAQILTFGTCAVKW